ncbi:MAG: pentapeptide repeat-containing protein, partial [Methylocella sp.]
LQGAGLGEAQLQGASLDGTQLQGAGLGEAQLQGASLRLAQLQGANFKGSTLAGTDMSGAAMWRANFEDASLTTVFEDDLKESGISKDEFAALKAMIMKDVPEGENREDALIRIEELNPDIFGPEATLSETLEKGRVDKTAYKKSLADQLKSLACSGDKDARYIVLGLANHRRINATGARAPGLVDAILKPDCPVSAALTDADKAALKRIAKEASAAH